MRVAERDGRADQDLVVAAQGGDRQALDELMAAYLPLVYNIVGRALDGHVDVDDVVQETLMRAVDRIGDLRDPTAFRAWVVAIAVRQVRDRWRRHQVQPSAAHGWGFELAPDAVDPGADFVDLTILQLELSGQRRETALATRWLEEGDRELLALWWLEAAGELDRAELAGALGIEPGHAAVRVQRLKARLDAARTVVRALDAAPRCAELSQIAARWDGWAAPSWRKQFARHVRECVACVASWQDLVPAERLLAGSALVPVPALLAATWLRHALPPSAPSAQAAAAKGVAGKGKAAKRLRHGGHGGRSGGLAAHVSGKLVAAAVAAAVAVGAGVVYAATSHQPQGSPSATAGARGAAGVAAAVASGSASASASASASVSASASASAKAAASSASSPAAGGASSTIRFMGKNTVMIGRISNDKPSVAAPFDAQYQYVVSPPAPSSSVYTAKSCPNGTNWWGCVWGGRGGLVPHMEARAAQATYKGQPHPQTMMWSWFELPHLTPNATWQDEVKAVNRVDLLTRYLNDYRFFVQKIGTSHDMIDLEADFWGFARGTGDVNKVPAQVTAAAPNDCGNQANTVAGLARCLISMTRKYAPHATVGLHLTCWDWPGNEKKCARDYVALGAKNADFLVGEVEAADAGLNALPENGGHNSFWSEKKWTAQLAYWKTMADASGKPIVVWQIPVGNMRQNNTPYHYKDDKVDWLFSHMDQVASAHVAALMFGQGSDKSTTIETDGGNLFRKTIAYRNSGGTPLK
ncbi:sigma-70 family RNA polymerase sigma factor [Streptomyces sp. NBC_01515]|uniref:RNA polymerase sigma factor n=1 Tax=Streptomyces sp. NBC_01515 TaxID=2903890 RepID=UPI00386AED0B